MGFNSVYQSLQELFPQVDARLLKAAAIEHSKDPDEAAEFILTEVIPHTTKQSDSSSSMNGDLDSSVEYERQFFACASSSKHELAAAGEAANGSGVMNPLFDMDATYLNETVKGPLGSTFYDAKDIGDQLSGNARGKELTASKTWEETGCKSVQDESVHDISASPRVEEVHNGDSNQESDDLDFPTVAHSALLTSVVLKDTISGVRLNNKQSGSVDSDDDYLSSDQNGAVPTESQKKPGVVSDSLLGSNYVELASLSVKDHRLEPLDCSIQSDLEASTSTSKLEIPEFSCAADTALNENARVPDNADIEESSSVNGTLSGQVCSTDLLEDIIEDSKRHKGKLFSDMESVLKLTREVELQEKITEQARQEVLRAGLEIDARVNELKSMLNHAREANDMHSGEVYAERAILATEMRELQSRLLALSDLKEESLSILDVMRQALEARVTAAELERIAAEHERYEREKSAWKALAEEELIMEKVVQESKILQQEAEENAKLREFLIDRGRVVDVLHGEICVICQDIKALKDKFDNRGPLSQSLFSGQTSCILASSGSSQKSTEPEQVVEHAKSSTSSDEPILVSSGSSRESTELEQVEHAKSSTSSDESILVPSAEQVTTDTSSELVEEGWELFEDVA